MKTKHIKLLPALFFLAFFSLIATTGFSQLACSQITHVKSGETGNFLIKKDGTVINGNEIYAVWGNIRVDNQKIDNDDVKTFHREGFYYIFHKRGLLKRVYAAKKFNVYAAETQRTSMSSGSMRTSYGCEWYIQDIETGKLSLLYGLTDLQKYVASCPAAVALLDLKEGQLRKAARNDRSYINNALDLHENGCKTVAKQQ